MARKTNTEIPSFNEIFNNLSKDPGYYDRPEEERREARANSRLRKWGKRAVAGVLIGGAAFGIGKGIDSYNDSQNAKEHTMVQQLDREFGAKLEPVAKSIAKDVYKHVQKVDGHRGEKGFENKHASIIDDTADPSKLVLNYTVDVQGGSYTERATVAKKSNGEPDLDTVFEAEVSEQAEEETTDRPLLRNDIAVSHGNNSVYSESKFQYWGGGVTFETPGGKSAEDKDGIDGFNTFYDYEDHYSDKDSSLKQADGVAELLPYALERLDGEVPII